MAKTIAEIAGFLLVCVAAGAMGSAFTARAIPEWYAALQKPPWTPPDRVFGPVWSALYLMMGLAAWLVWRKAGWTGATTALALFCVQLVLNVLWSALFFGMRAPGAAFIEIVLLWVMIAATLVSFWKITPAAGALLAPYLLWVAFAAALNLAVWRMNR
jgi:tryptophan-rich sensory protein